MDVPSDVFPVAVGGTSPSLPSLLRMAGMTQPRLLDLFCGSFGAGEGYRQAGFDVIGVDLVERPRPHGVTFVQADALDYLSAHGREFDAIHASPPCHDHTALKTLSGLDGTADLLPRTLAAVRKLGRPYVVENVAGAISAMPGALVLCGTEFGLGAVDRHGVYRHLRRHRLFLSSSMLMGAGGCHCAGRKVVGVYGHGGGLKMDNGYGGTLAESRTAMGMPWADRAGVSLAIPPAYTRHLGEQLLAHLAAERAA